MTYREPGEPIPHCRGCGGSPAVGDTRCGDCGYGLRPLPAPAQRVPAKTLFTAADPTDEHLRRQFRCPYCRSYGGTVKRMFVERYTAATCTFCGATQLFDLTRFNDNHQRIAHATSHD